MSTEPTDPVDPEPVEPKTSRQPRSPQDQQQAQEIAANGQTLDAVIAGAGTPGPIADALAEGGYALPELQRGQSLQVAAQSSLSAHLAALGAKDAATTAYLSAEKALLSVYTTLRGLARTAFLKNTAALTALGLSGRQPRDNMLGLINAANALLDNAQKPEYADKLNQRAVTAVKLQNLRTKLDALKTADQVQEDSKGAASKATVQRDQSAAALKAWMTEFKAFAKIQFKDQPDVLKSWGLK
jgi:hypothetical protein